VSEHGFEAEDLAKRFGKTTALDGVSLAIPPWTGRDTGDLA
jgi:ABC-type multidrug transport system ATPase subunit